MEARKTQLLRILVVILLQHHLQISLTLVGATSNVHIVYMGEKKYEDPVAITKSHHRFLSTVLGSKEAAKHSILYSYKHGFSGFAARLTKTQAEKIAELPGVVQVIPNGILKLHTTRSWEFMGLHYYQSSKNLSTESNMGEGTIIGIIDTGVWPESESFSDKGMGQAPVPPHWKGICQKGEKFNSSNCNRKDAVGHGTHTASTAAGYFVEKANYRGLAAGLARGGAPLAHLAIYKACWDIGCTDADVLKAFDKAIHDGVDVLSVSIGNEIPLFSYIDQRDSIAIGSFHAIAKGITVVSSAGNDGPVAQTIVNTAPWIITVGATTIDRAFPTAITLGNHQVLWVYNDCRQGSLNATLAAGKIILCFSRPDTQDIQSAAISVTQAGGVGLIYAQFHTDGLDSCNLIPCIKVNYEVGTQILSYIRRARSPIAKLSSPETVIGDLVSPRVASFSSRGPNSMSPAVLKPDIVAPGVDILAAYPPIGSKDIQGYALLSGTSMSCPHVAGIAALIKSLHRDWSPAAIRSALVTTASQTGTDGMNIFEEGSTRKEADPFDIGGGHVNPNKAMNPGLVYDITVEDYIQFLCFMGHNDASISRLTKSKINCLKNNHLALDLNLPSITIPNLHNNETVTVTRKVTNVGQINSAYEALVEAPYGVNMTVEPEVLSFNMTIKILSFRVTFFSNHKVHPVPDAEYRFGSLTWTDGEHFVRSPVAIRAIKFESYSDNV
ncbi:subtilisin-like protease SBT3.8 [Citrus sinensis]|nr:subtilisin-like protease SBT3.8 [Citrus sinensis]